MHYHPTEASKSHGLSWVVLRAFKLMGLVVVMACIVSTPCAIAATASWSVDPPAYDFGAVEPGLASTPFAFTLTNTGDVDLPPPRVDLSYSLSEGREPPTFDLIASDCEKGELFLPGESCKAEVTFTPHNPGLRTGSLIFVDPSSQAPTLSALFSGVGIGPIVSFSPPLASLGSLPLGEGPALPTVLTVSNSGDADLLVSGMSLINLGANPNHFAIVGGSCHPGGSVGPGAGCTVQLTFNPTQVGFVWSELQFEDNAARGSQTVMIQGIGVGPSTGPSAPLAVVIFHRPPKVSTKRSVTFRFGAGGVKAKFACKLDDRPYRACASPQRYSHLGMGQHVFRVKTLGEVEGVSPAPAVARFKIISKQALNHLR